MLVYPAGEIRIWEGPWRAWKVPRGQLWDEGENTFFSLSLSLPFSLPPPPPPPPLLFYSSTSLHLDFWEMPSCITIARERKAKGVNMSIPNCFSVFVVLRGGGKELSSSIQSGNY